MAGVQQVPAQNAIASWDDRDWDRLLGLLKIRQVVPIVGPDLLLGSIGSDGQPMLIALARDLAKRLGVSDANLSADAALTEVAWRFEAVVLTDVYRTVSMQDLYFHLSKVMETFPAQLSEPLRQLAQITDFPLYITTAFDTSLELALREANRSEPVSLGYIPNDPSQDLEVVWEKVDRPVVYHLLGRHSPVPYSYAVTEEDTLEFFHALLSPQRRPAQLFKELSQRNLLILGGGYSDWLARFFLRAMKGDRRLSDQRTVREFIADLRAVRQPSLVLFLQHFSRPTRLYADGDTAGFVAELFRRWCEKNPDKLQSSAVEPGVETSVTLPGQEVPDHAIFISYAKEDIKAVISLFKGLTDSGLRPWFDKNAIKAGDDWDPKTLGKIKRCELFLAIISRNTIESKGSRYFKTEWNYAWERGKSYFPHEHFFIPVVIDETDKNGAPVDDFLLIKQWEHLPGGQVNETFVNHLKEIVADRVSRSPV
jgi:hypothetical protein